MANEMEDENMKANIVISLKYKSVNEIPGIHCHIECESCDDAFLEAVAQHFAFTMHTLSGEQLHHAVRCAVEIHKPNWSEN